MSVTITERAESREIQVRRGGTREVLKFMAEGSQDDLAILNAVYAGTPTIFNGLVRDAINLRPRDNVVWEVDVEYAPWGQDGTGDPLGSTPSTPAQPAGADALGPQYSFDVGIETVKVTQSLYTKARLKSGPALSQGVALEIVSGTPPIVVSAIGDSVIADPNDIGRTLFVSGGTGWISDGYKIIGITGSDWELERSPGLTGATNGVWAIMPNSDLDYKQAVGVSNDRVEGVDVFRATQEWSRTVSRLTVTTDYLDQLANIVGKKNAGFFYGSSPGELVYLGASGSVSDNGRWSVTHKFRKIKSEVNIRITDDLIIPFKKGWDYLWVKYKHKVVNGILMQQADAAFIEEVIQDADFSQIGIG